MALSLTLSLSIIHTLTSPSPSPLPSHLVPQPLPSSFTPFPSSTSLLLPFHLPLFQSLSLSPILSTLYHLLLLLQGQETAPTLSSVIKRSQFSPGNETSTRAAQHLSYSGWNAHFLYSHLVCKERWAGVCVCVCVVLTLWVVTCEDEGKGGRVRERDGRKRLLEKVCKVICTWN